MLINIDKYILQVSFYLITLKIFNLGWFFISFVS